MNIAERHQEDPPAAPPSAAVLGAEMRPDWQHLPFPIVMHIAHDVGSSSSVSMAAAKTLLRLVCRAWRQALPLGQCVPAKIWSWEHSMATSLAPHARFIEVLCPLPHPSARPLPQLARSCRHLRRLKLRHMHAHALPALAAITSLTSLHATVYFPDAEPSWLDFAVGLPRLEDLHLAAAVVSLQPEEGLARLLPLRCCLRRLRLEGCLLLTDSGAELLVHLSCLERLEVTCCQLSQAGLDALAAALPRLAHAELRLQDGVAADRLLTGTAIASSGGSLALHLTRAMANGMVAAAGQQAPGLSHLTVRPVGSGFLLTAPPTFHLLHSLTHLSLPRIQLPADAVRQLAACTCLQQLEAELNFTVRDGDLLSWRSLALMRRLNLTGNFYLGEVAVAAVLGAMPHMQELRLEQMQGSGAMLAPLAAMPDLHTLELTSCHLNEAGALGAALQSATALHCLRVKYCGVQSEVCQAVVAALPLLPHLQELELELRRAPAPATAEALAFACASCTQLTALDARFAGYAYAAPAVLAWRQLSTLSSLRSLRVCTGLGWDGEAFAAVAAAAAGLRNVTLTDNAGSVDDSWTASLAAARQLSSLQLNSCRRLGAPSAAALCHLTALTGLTAFRCPGLSAPELVQQMHGSLPCLASLSMHE